MIYVVTGVLSVVTGVLAGILGRQGIARIDHARRHR